MNVDIAPPTHIPRATYRLQLTPEFGFAAARELVPYLNRLGVSDIYCSPILTARPGSTHGYDVIDPLHVNPQLGGQTEFERLALAARQHDMSLLIDIVPNHMAASIDNPWWYDVLKKGPSSRYAHFFDIEWEPADPNESLHNRVLLPILGAPYGETLEKGEIRIEPSADGYTLRYFEHRLPIALESFAPILNASGGEISSVLGNTNADWANVQTLLTAISQLPSRDHFDAQTGAWRQQLRERLITAIAQLHTWPGVDRALDHGLAAINGQQGNPRSYDRLDRIIRRQSYRLAFWQVAREQINYRRFFDINDLVSLRVEDEDVFDTTHRLILELVRSGTVNGLRVDHIDGLWDPYTYLRTLRARLDDLNRAHQSPYVVVEKILAFDESLPERWPVDGTTGYDMLNTIGDLFVDTERLPALESSYRRMSGVTESYAEIVYTAKRQLLESTFAAYVRSLTFDLEGVSNSDRHGRDLTFDVLQQALIETTSAMPVYRTYVRDSAVSNQDRFWIMRGIEAARSRRPDLRSALDFLERVLTLEIPGYVAKPRHPAWLDVVMRWQQLCGPVMAKGNEDTALYRFFPLSSRNEVGGHPDHTPESIDEAHVRLQWMAEHSPLTMIAGSTHDTKRSEDVRARIAVLSEMPDEWSERLAYWQSLNTDKRAVRDAAPIPDGNVEYLIYQTMVGAWPLDSSDLESFRPRLRAYITKAVREAKEHSSWVEPDFVYEDALLGFVDALLDGNSSNRFLSDFEAFTRRIARIGALNSLSQTLLKLTAPGIPDFYQGTELWDFSLVDPDNRRSVDYLRRSQALEITARAGSGRESLHELSSSWRDGRIKLMLIQHGLRLRRCHPTLFSHGSYTPVRGTGSHAANILSYVRSKDGEMLLAVAPRLCSAIIDDGDELTAAFKWGTSLLALPRGWDGPAYDLFSGETIPTVNVQSGPSLRLSDVFRHFPVGLVGNEAIFAMLQQA